MLRNVTRDVVIARRPSVALLGWARARGMIANEFRDFDAMIFPRCRSIHTFFMGQALDVIFLDASGRVLGVHPGVRPWRIVMGPPGAATVIELPPGTLCGISVQLDDMVSWSA